MALKEYPRWVKGVAGILAALLVTVIGLYVEYNWFQPSDERPKVTDEDDRPGEQTPPGTPDQASVIETPGVETPVPPTPAPVDLAEQARSVAEAKGTEVLTEKAVKGTIAKDASKEYVFIGQANKPLLFELAQPSKHFWADLKIHDSSGLTRLDDGFIRDETQIAFTPPRDDVYTLSLKGERNYGDFLISVSSLERADNGGDGADTGKLVLGQGTRGAIAVDAVKSYTFAGQQNQPLLFTLEQTSRHFWADVEVRDSEGRALLNDGFIKKQDEIAFTPPKTGTYTLVLKGDRNFGDFLIVMSILGGS